MPFFTGVVRTRLPVAAKMAFKTAGATAMNSGMNSLALRIQQSLRRDPHAGDLYVFRGKSGKLIKIFWLSIRFQP